MTELCIKKYLGSNSYPGRGIILGITPDGENAAAAYFTMGRSINSRNRIFVEDGEGIKNEAFDPSKMVDPSLIIYSPVRVVKDYLIVTNGDQTDTIYNFISEGKSFEEALYTRIYEPDAPNYTPRISGTVNFREDGVSYKLSILKNASSDSENVCRYFFSYDLPMAGKGHFIHTYECDGDPIPSFSGEPRTVSIGNDIDVFSSDIWNSLNNENKVSLFVRFINIRSRKSVSRIFNKLESLS